MSALLLCCGCDAIRDVERAFCASCGEATDSYAYEPTERETFVMKQRQCTPVAFERSATFDGDPISPATADEIRQLGRPTLHINYNRKAA